MNIIEKTPLRALRRAIALLLCLTALPALADEGMWMLGNLDKGTRRTLKELGLKLPANKLYHPKKPSLKDAVVSFGGFCSGVVVSEDGLVLTNHHCGFSSIQQLSSLEHDYLQDGFVAKDRSTELPCPDLYVRFMLRQEDVTRRVLSAVKPGMDEFTRHNVTDSVCLAIEEEVYLRDSTLVGTVDAYYVQHLNGRYVEQHREVRLELVKSGDADKRFAYDFLLADAALPLLY